MFNYIYLYVKLFLYNFINLINCYQLYNNYKNYLLNNLIYICKVNYQI
jgi:hypothetical protein